MKEEYSFVCIEEEELEKLKKLAYEIKPNYQTDIYNKIIDKINRIEKKSLQQELFVYDLNGELKYFELELQRKYEEQLSKLDDFKSKCIELFKLQKEDYMKLIEEQNRKINFILDKINQGINTENIFDNFSKKKEAAKILCEDLKKIIYKLNNIPNKDLYSKQLSKINYLFNQCLNDMEKGFYESSMSIARLVYSNILDFRNYFIEQEEKHYNLINILNTKIEYIKDKIKTNKNIKFKYENNYFDLDVSFWSNNLIDKIYNEIETLQNISLQENDNNKILLDIYKYENEVDNLINKSKLNIISSQIRANIASKCINILLNSKFNIINYSYINNDMRNDFKIIVENLIKDKFIILIKTLDNSKTILNISLLENDNSKDKEFKLKDIKKLFSINGIIINNE
ncbi:MAG: hypothetical protein KatS3mg068_2531 [Candidatus Sericytochromatia bacterium]|nr:MAG: hypothetical protein KatS3mg068_2531 [Candidatus Sericytochromatia bacterium]